ncbi:MAG TPA: restriction endonuclease subunit S [Longimicrobiales bacterium]|nr:restriction endonuclease subunit S [Longimicrobiales bacterium]
MDKKSEEGERPVRLCNYVDVYKNEFITSDLDFMLATATDAQIREFRIRPNDVLATKDSETADDIAVPALVIADEPDLVCGYHLTLIRPDRAAYGPYLFRAMQAVGVTDQFRLSANGVTRFGLPVAAFTTAVFPLPPLPEQRAIAAFLDRETERIDTLVAKKKRLLELLDEKRTALIARAVTKGLDPDVPLKGSGVEWLGKVPERWEVTALKKLGSFQAGAGFPDEEQGLADEELPFFKVGDMAAASDGVTMTDPRHTVSRETATRLRAAVLPTGAIVFAKVGAALLLNRRRFLGQPSCIDNNMMGFLPGTCDAQWAFHWLAALDLGRLANPGAVPSVSEGQMRTISVPLPPLPEQRAIAAYIDRETARIDALKTKIQKAIDLLKEYRTALISAAVTGKIDVRGEVAEPAA